MSKRKTVSLHHLVLTEVTNTYEIDPDHFKQITGTDLYDATAGELEDYVLDNYSHVTHWDHAEEVFLEETLHEDWTLED